MLRKNYVHFKLCFFVSYFSVISYSGFSKVKFKNGNIRSFTFLKYVMSLHLWLRKF